jgi:predicted methyltransferase
MRHSLLLAGLLAAVTPSCAASAPAPAAAAAPGAGASAAPPAASAAAPAASGGSASSSPDLARYQALVDAADRDPEDRKLDGGRHPAELLAFLGLTPGMKVAEIGAGGGYTAELFARAVGPSGVVYGQNSPAMLQRFAEKPWSLRLQKPVMKNVVRVDSDFDAPIPPDVHDLDAVTIVLFYHDTVWLKTDREKMNRAVLAALKPGGVYVVIDHSGQPGTFATQTDSLHRIEEKVVRDEVQHAGFELEAEAGFLRNPEDTRDWNPSPRAAGERRGTSDRFVLKFRKP